MKRIKLLTVIIGAVASLSNIAYGYDGSKLIQATGHVNDYSNDCLGQSIDEAITEAKRKARLVAESRCTYGNIEYKGHVWLLNVKCVQESIYSLPQIGVTAAGTYLCRLE